MSDVTCDMSPIWDLTFSWTLGIEACMAKLQNIHLYVAICEGYS